jgi:hypothetical protein
VIGQTPHPRNITTRLGYIEHHRSEETMLKRAIAIGALIAASWVVSANPAAAQFNERWCTQGWMTDCAYQTLDQCRAAASGNGWTCVQNPSYPPPKQRQKRKKRGER